jgi:hypothetical protein
MGYEELSVAPGLEYPVVEDSLQPRQHARYDSILLRLVAFLVIVCWDFAFGLTRHPLTLLCPEQAQTSEVQGLSSRDPELRLCR